MKFIKRFWWVLLLAIFCPLFVNWLLSVSTGIKVYENGWLGFWGTFFGALFPFIILYNTLKDNHKENEKGRKTQSGTIEYQVSKECLNDIKRDITSFYKAMNIQEIERLSLLSNTTSHSVSILWDTIKNIENAYQVLRLSLVDYNDPTETTFKTFLFDFKSAYIELLIDFAWLLDCKIPLVEYKEQSKKTGNVTIECLRVWKVIEDSSYNQETDKDKIMNELLQRIEYKAIYLKSESFIAYENDRIKSKRNKFIGINS